MRPWRMIAILFWIALAASALRAEDVPAYFEDHDGIRVLHLWGTPRERGRRFGEAVREEIPRLRDDYLRKVADTPEKWAALEAASKKMEKWIPENLKEEMRGIAAGSGEAYETVLMANTFLDAERGVACSTFAAVGDASADGAPIFGRNLDFLDLGVAHKYSLVLVEHLEEGRALLSVTWPGMIGVVSGMNQDGLSLAVMNVYGKGDGICGVPYTILFRRILEECDKAEEAVELARSVDRTCGNNLMVCDAEGNALVIEMCARGVEVRRPENGRILSTNHFRAPIWKGNAKCRRYEKLAELLRPETRPVDMDRAIEALKAVAMNLPALGTGTIQSMVFRPRSGTLHVAFGEFPAIRGPFIELRTRDLFRATAE